MKKQSTGVKIVSGGAIVLAGLTLVTGFLWFIDAHIIQPAFITLERRQAMEDGRRVTSSIDNEISSLARHVIDWANWDDTYLFADQPGKSYKDSNYPDPGMLSKSSHIDLLAIFDRKGTCLLQGMYHPDQSRQIPSGEISAGSTSLLLLLPTMFSPEEGKDGLLSTNQGELILVSRPILTSQGEGPSRGFVVMGRFLNKATLGGLAAQVEVPFSLLRKEDPSLTPFERHMFSGTAAGGKPSSFNFHQGSYYQMLNDLDHNPSLLLRSKIRKEISALGRRTGDILLSVLWLLAFSLLICLVIYRARMKSSEEELRESEERYRVLFENRHTVMLLVDPQTGSIKDANQAACIFYGWSRDELKKKYIQQINSLSESEVFAEMAKARSEKRSNFFFKHRKADNSLCDVEVYSGPMTIKGQTFLYSIVHDISARKRAEAERDQLEKKTRQLEKAESLGRMAAAIAHLFNNHLSVVIGSLEMALETLPEKSPQHSHIRLALQAGWKASETSKLMLTYLGMNIQPLELFDLSAACLEYLPILRDTVPKNVVLTNGCMSSGPQVHIDEGQLQRVLSHLVTNGWEAMGGKGGEIILKTSIVSLPEIPRTNIYPSDAALKGQRFACLAVEDSGCGMTEEALGKIYDPFYSTKFAGRGMGIPIIIGIVKGWGGVVAVESSPGKGSTFRIFLPLPNSEDQGQDAPVFQRKPQQDEASPVLLVDDQGVV